MKTKVNRNFFWCEKFVEELYAGGVKYACISPGSRSTSLTLAFARNKKIKTFVNIDERSSAFFALGLAKKTNMPVVLVCTSGTAAAEFYPAIVEAYQQRVPLIVCTADRPKYLYNTGANQTINQIDLYKNHIRWFVDAGLPELTKDALLRIIRYANHAVDVAVLDDKGPVHINFPFEKPFEPDAYTDEIDDDILNISFKETKSITRKKFEKVSESSVFDEIYRSVKNLERGLIIAGPDNYNKERIELIIKVSERLNYPILADALSQVRFSSVDSNNLICNYEEIFRNEQFINEYKPDIILQFGRTPISKTFEKYFEKNSLNRILINKYADRFDPAGTAKMILPFASYQFCGEMLYRLDHENFKRKHNKWRNAYLNAELVIEKQKSAMIYSADFPNETRILDEVLQAVPSLSSVFISNSLPVRDLNRFTSWLPKDLKIFFNRGASGIDGIISTAAGVCAADGKQAYLVTGDLAFYYDMNVLPLLKRLNIPLNIILINNNGGAIFSSLPVSKNGNHYFDDYFLTPHNLDFGSIVKGYGLYHHEVTSWEDLKKEILPVNGTVSPRIFEIKTDPAASAELRKKYSEKVSVTFEKELII